MPTLPSLSSHLDAEAGLHQVELVHKLLVERPHVLRHKLLVHGQAVLQDVSLRGEGGPLENIHNNDLTEF